MPTPDAAPPIKDEAALHAFLSLFVAINERRLSKLSAIKEAA